ncbi:hypothetical protein DB459_23295 [Bradyrhizobium sp. WD16]|nr:hypothetical protein DB459_23295 [Bradyrhizobium sp. WD16]
MCILISDLESSTDGRDRQIEIRFKAQFLIGRMAKVLGSIDALGLASHAEHRFEGSIEVADALLNAMEQTDFEVVVVRQKPADCRHFGDACIGGHALRP